jgi:predicted metalloprotease with PDZ domain
MLTKLLFIVFFTDGSYPKGMKTHYIVDIENPERHIVKVTLKTSRLPGKGRMNVFLPSWSPGSYLVREYARHIRRFEASQSNGEILLHRQIAKNMWEIDWEDSDIKTETTEFQVSYEIYLKELTVRTSHVDASHAFLHGPSYLMGTLDYEIKDPTIEFRFPPTWSKLSTALKDVSDRRDLFLYSAEDYDVLVDTPVEIGCQETDGFEFQGKPHHLAYYGELMPHKNDLKKDIKQIVSTVAQHFDNDLPYEQYLFLTHFVPKLYGGLEHLNSTALQFDGRKLSNRRDYLNYLSLVGHEYFHLWNVKRIRPQELGPFDYMKENYTSMLWLAEGLTSFMDDLFVFRAGLSSLEEYLDVVKGNLENYLGTPGRRYHSLEQSSYNAWVKLYRPDEYSKNSSVSYYLKGGLVFTVLHALLLQKGQSVDRLLKDLWKGFKERPKAGYTKEEVYGLVQKLGGEDVLAKFSTMVETTEDIDFESAFKSMGCELRFTDPQGPWIGVDWDFHGDRAVVKSVLIDSPAYKAGLNSGDEIIAVNGFRFFREDAERLGSQILIEQSYEWTFSRLGRIQTLSMSAEKLPRQLREIAIVDRQLAQKSFSFA